MTLLWLCRLAGSPSSLQRPFHVVEVIAAHAQKLAVRVLRSDGRPPPRKTRFPAAGPALSDGIGYPQGFNEGFHIFEMILLSRAFVAQCRALLLIVITPVARSALIALGTAYSNRFPVPSGCGLPSSGARSASTLVFSRPAQRLLAITACRLAESPKRPVCLGGSDGFVSSTAAPIATGWR